jgi:hypothetical protein
MPSHKTKQYLPFRHSLGSALSTITALNEKSLIQHLVKAHFFYKHLLNFFTALNIFSYATRYNVLQSIQQRNIIISLELLIKEAFYNQTYHLNSTDICKLSLNQYLFLQILLYFRIHLYKFFDLVQTH